MTLPHELPKVVSELQSQRQQSVRKLRSIALDFIQGITDDALSSFHFLPVRNHLPSYLSPAPSEPAPPNPAPPPAKVTRSRNSKRKAPAAGLNDQHTRPTRRTRRAAQTQAAQKAVVSDKENVDLTRPTKGKRPRTRRAARPPLIPVAVNEGKEPTEVATEGSKHPPDQETPAVDKIFNEASSEARPESQMQAGAQREEDCQQHEKERNGRGLEGEVCRGDIKDEESFDQDLVTGAKQQKKRKGKVRGKGKKRNRMGAEIVKGDNSEPSHPDVHKVLDVSGVVKKPRGDDMFSPIERSKGVADQREHSNDEIRASRDLDQRTLSFKDPQNADSNQSSSDGESPVVKRRLRKRVKGKVNRAPPASTNVRDHAFDLDRHSDHEKLPSPRETKEGVAGWNEDKCIDEKKDALEDGVAEDSGTQQAEPGENELDRPDQENASSASSSARSIPVSTNSEIIEELPVAGGHADDSGEDVSHPEVRYSDREEEENLVPQPSGADSECEDEGKAPDVECTLSPKLHIRDVTQETEPGIQSDDTGTLFTVGKDGMIGQATIGALSQLALTPATSHRGQAEEKAEIRAGTNRRTRLFNPKTSIYPSSRKPPLQSSKGLSSAAQFVQAPQTSDTVPAPNGGVSFQTPAIGPKYISFKDSIASDTHAQPLVLGNPDISRPSNARYVRQNGHLVPFMGLVDGQSTEPISPGKRGTCGESLTNSSSVEVRSSVAFNTERNEEVSPSRDTTRIKSLFKEGPYPSVRMNNSKTAPGRRAFPPPTDRKLTKSAYRQRIERLHANAHALSSIGGNSQNHSESDLEPAESKICVEPAEVQKNEDHSDVIESQRHSAFVDSSGSRDINDCSPTVSGTIQKALPGEQKSASNSTTKKESSPRCGSAKKDTSSNASLMSPSENCKNDMTNRVREKLRKSRTLSVEREVANSSENDASSGCEEKQNDQNTLEVEEDRSPRKSCNAANATKNPYCNESKTTCDEPKSSDMDTISVSPFVAKSRDESDVADLTTAPQSSRKSPVPDAAISNAPNTEGLLGPTESTQGPSQAPSTSTFSNLVSSVASFLPAGSSLFGSHADPKAGNKATEDQAKLASKRLKEDGERREAELIAKREAMRLLRQKEGQERQKKAENRRKLLAELEKHREEERRKKEALRIKKRREEEEKQRLKKEEEDKRKEEHRRRVLEQKQKRMMASKQGAREGQYQTKLRRPGQANNRHGQLNGSKGKTLVSDALPPKTPKSNRPARAEEEPQWELTGERKRGISENSEEERDRRRRKKIPQWAGSSQVWQSLRNESSDPDAVFARGAPSCNLETVFQGTEGKRRFRPREDSGDWTKDRLTAKEEMEYKRKAGFFDNV